MSNYFEYEDKIAFHPGYYIKEIVNDSRLTQEDFAKRLDTTPKNLSLLIRGEQSLSIDIATKLSRLLGTSVNYWLNIQMEYDSLVAEFDSKKELTNERMVFKFLDYSYFKENFQLPALPRKIDEQIVAVRELLNVATLSTLCKKDMAVSFRSAAEKMNLSSVVKANVMVQLATNIALNKLKENVVPKFDKKKFNEIVDYALTLTTDHNTFYNILKEKFLEVGVVFVVLPNISGSKINGATKKIGNNIMLMVNDRRLYADSFWFTLFHEIAHIINGDFGISFDKESGKQEHQADLYAENKLIPLEEYKTFVSNKNFSVSEIKRFAKTINRDPGIVVGRLQNENLVRYDDEKIKSLKRKYKVKINLN